MPDTPPRPTRLSSIDAHAFPDIVNAIIDVAPLHAWPVLRATCRAFKERIDALGSHVVVSGIPTVDMDGDDAMNDADEGRFEELSLEVTAVSNGLSVRRSTNEDAHLFDWVVSGAKVIDLGNGLYEDNLTGLPRLRHAEDVLVRLLPHAEVTGRVPHAGTYVFFPSSVGESVPLSKDTRKVVVHVDRPTLANPLPGDNSPPFDAWDLPDGIEVVFIFPAWLAEDVAALDAADDTTMSDFLETTFVSLVQLILVPNGRHTLVNFDGFAQPLLGRGDHQGFWGATFDLVKDEFMAALSDEVAGHDEDEVIDKMLESIMFLGLSEFRTTLTEGEWELIMDGGSGVVSRSAGE